jgi:esterase
MPQSKFIEANGVRLHYLDWGKEGAQPLVMLHGHPLNAHAWADVAEAFTGSYHVIAVDARGHGDSDWSPPYGGEAFIPDLRAVIERLPVRPVILCGNSMGGTTAYSYAAQYPGDVERLVLVDTVSMPPPSDPTAAARPPGPPPLPAGPFSSPEQAMELIPAIMGPAFQRAMVNENLKPDGSGRWTWKFDYEGTRGGFERARNEPLWEYWRAVVCPTLILRGERSPACPIEVAERAAKAHQNAALVTVPDAGHFIAIEQPSSFVAEVTKWLEA